MSFQHFVKCVFTFVTLAIKLLRFCVLTVFVFSVIPSGFGGRVSLPDSVLVCFAVLFVLRAQSVDIKVDHQAKCYLRGRPPSCPWQALTFVVTVAGSKSIDSASL